jgi:hypothetical protein
MSECGVDEVRSIGGAFCAGEGRRKRMRVMVAHSMVSYREVISFALERLRPHVETFIVEPENLDREFMSLSPQLVVCSRVTDIVERGALGWIELYPEQASESVVSLCGEWTIYPDMDLDTLLSVLDETRRLYEIT